MNQVSVSVHGRELALPEIGAPLALEMLLPGEGEWEIEIGFGKGRYLLRRAEDQSQRRFMGIEMAAPYYRLARRRLQRKSLTNLALVRGEALFVLAAVLPAGFASAVHVYFPDPWPKARHHKRRLFDPETVDLVLGLLRPGGQLFFATDHLDYGSTVQGILESHPATEVSVQQGVWPNGARTNYEVKYETERRPILRLQVTWRPGAGQIPLHPLGASGIVAATSARSAELDPPA
jgi:tRNA (guanine-N7-)-methyltransferase